MGSQFTGIDDKGMLRFLREDGSEFDLTPDQAAFFGFTDADAGLAPQGATQRTDLNEPSPGTAPPVQADALPGAAVPESVPTGGDATPAGEPSQFDEGLVEAFTGGPPLAPTLGGASVDAPALFDPSVQVQLPNAPDPLSPPITGASPNDPARNAAIGISEGATRLAATALEASGDASKPIEDTLAKLEEEVPQLADETQGIEQERVQIRQDAAQRIANLQAKNEERVAQGADPGRWWNSRTSFQKASGLFAAFAQGFLRPGDENIVVSMLAAEVDKDIALQVAQIDQQVAQGEKAITNTKDRAALEEAALDAKFDAASVKWNSLLQELDLRRQTAKTVQEQQNYDVLIAEARKQHAVFLSKAVNDADKIRVANRAQELQELSLLRKSRRGGGGSGVKPLSPLGLTGVTDSRTGKEALARDKATAVKIRGKMGFVTGAVNAIDALLKAGTDRRIPFEDEQQVILNIAKLLQLQLAKPLLDDRITDFERAEVAKVVGNPGELIRGGQSSNATRLNLTNLREKLVSDVNDAIQAQSDTFSTWAPRRRDLFVETLASLRKTTPTSGLQFKPGTTVGIDSSLTPEQVAAGALDPIIKNATEPVLTASQKQLKSDLALNIADFEDAKEAGDLDRVVLLSGEIQKIKGQLTEQLGEARGAREIKSISSGDVEKAKEARSLRKEIRRLEALPGRSMTDEANLRGFRVLLRDL